MGLCICPMYDQPRKEINIDKSLKLINYGFKNEIKNNQINFYDYRTLEKILNMHNDYRKKHNSLPLKLNYELVELAQEYEENLFINNNNIFTQTYNNEVLGENVFYSPLYKSPELICKEWYNEFKYYDYNYNKFQKNTVHFTQIVWKKTKEVGFAFVDDKSKSKSCGVALYYPAGNKLGDFQENVEKPE